MKQLVVMTAALCACGLGLTLGARGDNPLYPRMGPLQVTGMMAPVVHECGVEVPNNFPPLDSFWDQCAPNAAIVLERYDNCKKCCDLAVPGPGNGACRSQCASEWLAAIQVVMLIWGNDGTCDDVATLLADGPSELGELTEDDLMALVP